MINKVEDYFLSEPKRLIELGKILSQAGATLVVIGLFGRVATTSTGMLHTLSGQANEAKTLAELFPSLPTWWIPESFFGFALPIVICAFGFWLSLLGKKVQRYLR